MMLLRFHCKERALPKYERLAKELNADKRASEKGLADKHSDSEGPGVYIEDVEKWLVQRDFIFAKCERKSYRNMVNLLEVSPVMAATSQYAGHWVIVKGVDEKSVFTNDPQGGIRTVSRATFWKKWDGTAIAIIGEY
jgi:hypothetical protein